MSSKRAVRVVIQDGLGHVLLITPGPRKPRTTKEIPGGKIEPDDKSLADAAKREVLEETGLDLPPEDFESLGLANFDNQAEGAWEINLFRVRVQGQVELAPPRDLTEVTDIEWYEPASLDVQEAISVYGFNSLEELLTRRVAE